MSSICGDVRVLSLAKWRKHGSWWIWFSCRQICVVSESISNATSEFKGNGIQWQTKNEPEKAKFNYKSLTIFCFICQQLKQLNNSLINKEEDVNSNE